MSTDNVAVVIDVLRFIIAHKNINPSLRFSLSSPPCTAPITSPRRNVYESLSAYSAVLALAVSEASRHVNRLKLSWDALELWNMYADACSSVAVLGIVP